MFPSFYIILSIFSDWNPFARLAEIRRRSSSIRAKDTRIYNNASKGVGALGVIVIIVIVVVVLAFFGMFGLHL